MAVIIPTEINLHTQSPASDLLDLENIGASNRGTKSGGNLPLTLNAAQVNNSTVGTLQGTAYQFPSSFDSTVNTKILIWAWQFNAPNRIQVDALENNGIIGRLYAANSSNYIQFRIGGNNTLGGASQSGALTFILDPQSSSFNLEQGNFNGLKNNIAGYGWASTRFNLFGGSSTLAFFQRAYLFDTIKNGELPKFIGNSNYDDIILEILGTNYTNKKHTFVSKLGNSYTLNCPFQIGDNGGTVTTFNDNNATILSPSSNDLNDPRFHLSNQAMRVYLSLGINDNITISGTYIWGTQADFDFNSSIGASVNLSNAVFTGMGDFIVGSDIILNNTTFNLNDKNLIVNNTSIDNITCNNNVILNNEQLIINSLICERLSLNYNYTGTIIFNNCIISELENLTSNNSTIEIVLNNTNTPVYIETNGIITAPSTYTISDAEGFETYLIAWDTNDLTTPIYNYTNTVSHVINTGNIVGDLRIIIDKPGFIAKRIDYTIQGSSNELILLEKWLNVDTTVDISDLINNSTHEVLADPYGIGFKVYRATINYSGIITLKQWQRFTDYMTETEEAMTTIATATPQGQNADDIYSIESYGVNMKTPSIEVVVSNLNDLKVQAFIDQTESQSLYPPYIFNPRNSNNINIEFLSVKPLIDYNTLQDIIKEELNNTDRNDLTDLKTHITNSNLI